MSENSKIEWTDATFNPWIGCTKVSPACDHCYAEVSTPARALGVIWGPKVERRRTSASNWKLPLRWEREHEAFFAQHGRRRRVFCASLADVFDNQVPDAWRAELFDLIYATPNLDWLLLTKRIGNVQNMLVGPGMPGRMPSHVWLGTTIVNRDEMLRDADKLKATGARVAFWSVEPMLGDLGAIPYELLPDWVICGGESGQHARAMHPDWVRSLRNQCEAAGVPFMFKQHGEWAPGSGDFGAGRYETAAIARDGRMVQGGYDASRYPAGATGSDGWAMVHRPGKKAAGRLLDGVQYDGYPETSSKRLVGASLQLPEEPAGIKEAG